MARRTVTSDRCGCKGRHQVHSLDDLVGKREQGRRDFKTERSRGLHVDKQLELAVSYDWQVGRFIAFENATIIEAD